jgi:hypothetical protein
MSHFQPHFVQNNYCLVPNADLQFYYHRILHEVISCYSCLLCFEILLVRNQIQFLLNFSLIFEKKRESFRFRSISFYSEKLNFAWGWQFSSKHSNKSSLIFLIWNVLNTVDPKSELQSKTLVVVQSIHLSIFSICQKRTRKVFILIYLFLTQEWR